MAWPKIFNAPRFALAFMLAMHMGSASASVVLPNTRVIYAGNAQEKGIQFTNQDDAPSVMQVWVDSGNADSTPETADAPFVVTPPVFRIEPKAGQTVRLVFTGKQLPQDRESVFYLNTLQIPSVGAAYANENQMLVMLRNRLKLFYRPAGLEHGAQGALEKLSFRLKSEGKALRITATNPTGYFISLTGGQLVGSAQAGSFEPDMLAPRSEASWDVQGAAPPAGESVRVKVTYVDDFGAVREAEYPTSQGQGVP